MPDRVPGTRPTLLLTLASTGGYPKPISVGNVMSVPEPTTVLIVPAAMPAPKMARASTAVVLTHLKLPAWLPGLIARRDVRLVAAGRARPVRRAPRLGPVPRRGGSPRRRRSGAPAHGS